MRSAIGLFLLCLMMLGCSSDGEEGSTGSDSLHHQTSPLRTSTAYSGIELFADRNKCHLDSKADQVFAGDQVRYLGPVSKSGEVHYRVEYIGNWSSRAAGSYVCDLSRREASQLKVKEIEFSCIGKAKCKGKRSCYAEGRWTPHSKPFSKTSNYYCTDGAWERR